jgi:hypothetical protein
MPRCGVRVDGSRPIWLKTDASAVGSCPSSPSSRSAVMNPSRPPRGRRGHAVACRDRTAGRAVMHDAGRPRRRPGRWSAMTSRWSASPRPDVSPGCSRRLATSTSRRGRGPQCLGDAGNQQVGQDGREQRPRAEHDQVGLHDGIHGLRRRGHVRGVEVNASMAGGSGRWLPARAPARRGRRQPTRWHPRCLAARVPVRRGCRPVDSSAATRSPPRTSCRPISIRLPRLCPASSPSGEAVFEPRRQFQVWQQCRQRLAQVARGQRAQAST